jgi:hypothetical protein
MSPMQLSPRVKMIVIAFLVIGALAYVLLLEFAINAGRVHRGVDVQGYDIGGLNYAEATDALNERGTEMKLAPMIFTTEGFDCRFTPAHVGWGPQPSDTADEAMEVGRTGGVMDALRERLQAWTDGVSIEWADAPDAAKVGRELNRCEKQAAGLGLEIARPKLRYAIRKAIVTWPREPVAIPLLP